MRTSATLSPSGPAAPLFDATFSNASRNLDVTSSIVANATVLSLFLDFGVARGRAAGRPAAAPPSTCEACASPTSAVSKNSPSCRACLSTGIAFPPSCGSPPRVGTAFRRPFGTMRSSDFCRAIAVRPLGHRLRGARQISLGKKQQTSRRPVASTPAPPTKIGLSLLGASLPSTDALRRFTSRSGLIAHLLLPPDVPSRDHRGCAPAAEPVLRIDALVSSVSGSLRQGPGYGLSPPVCCSCQPHPPRTFCEASASVPSSR